MKVKSELVVSRIIEGYGFEGFETRKTREGEDFKVYVTVWTKDKVTIGDSVEVTGDLTAKVDSYTGKDNQPKTKVSLNINDPVVKTAEAPF
jgi:hypothetical protein